MSDHIASSAHDVPGKPGEEPRILDHAYDGIREYDNPMPGWWTWTFAVTVAFAAAYGFYYHVANRGESAEQRYQATLAEYNSKKDVRARAEAANVSEKSLTSAVDDPTQRERGAAVFQQRCASCHGDKGQGLVGPNLTDLTQLHGSSRMDLYTTVSSGVSGTAMLAWGDQMPQTDVLSVTAFVISLRGTNVPGKEPQGTVVGAF